MNYADTNAGRVQAEASEPGRVKSFWTFDDVETRLAEAMRLWWQAPDRERGWQHVKAMWPEIQRHGWRVDVDGEFDERPAIEEPRPLPLTRDQVAEMIEASEWLAHAPERDRKLVAIVLVYHAKGAREVPWKRIWERLGRGKPGPDGLRKRYSRAIAAIAKVLSR
jgi:hypothetical protein